MNGRTASARSLAHNKPAPKAADNGTSQVRRGAPYGGSCGPRGRTPTSDDHSEPAAKANRRTSHKAD